jgi:hypothetical protein
MLGVRAPDHAGAPARQDWQWNQYFLFEITPHPRLTPSQQEAVAKDFGMKNGKRELSVRYAMLYYVLKRLGLLGDAAMEDPRRQFRARVRAVAVALSRAGRPPVRIEFVNDPEGAEALAPYRLAPEVLARNESIEIGGCEQAQAN